MTYRLRYNGSQSILQSFGTEIMDKCYLVTRDKMYDVFISGKKLGSGPQGYMSTAYYFYKSEGFDVEIVYG